ncbi:lectin subunit alpha-like [Haematobia irritans]|uniref:lectin subunit alpha-like n=1 Tax=Haematobia irritans TaxID=7368 RepID=UPI003F5045D7
MCLKKILTGLLLLQVINLIYGQQKSKYYRSDKGQVFYIEHEQYHDWFQALTACARLKMQLLTIETKEKSDDVNSLVLKSFGKNIPLWVGGYAIGPSRQYTWISNGNPFVYTYWNPSQPDWAGNNEYCAQIGWGKEMQWNDHQCLNKFGFICEYSDVKRIENDWFNSNKYSGLAFQINNNRY